MSVDSDPRSEHPLLIAREGHSECLLGNEAIVRGALEAGVAFACGYPGTPSSEITDTFARIAKTRGIVFEYSVNEKVALEMAFATSLAGARSLCAMKHLGLLVAGDPLATIPYIGVEAGMVVVSAGDPGCSTSPNEQDQRLLGPMLHVPVLDPSTPQEAHDMTLFAFELSEKSRLPVILRATTRVCHSRAAVRYGRLREAEVRGFVRDPKRYVPIPTNARRMRVELLDRLEHAGALVAGSGFFRCEGSGPLVILAAGSPAATCADLLDEERTPPGVALWSLGVLHPLPEAEIVERLREVERVLVVEELEPFVEDRLRLLCARHGLTPEILGKRTGHLPATFEYEPDVIRVALGEFLGARPEGARRGEPFPVPHRPPTFCPGCPHRAAFIAARSVFDEDQLYFNDIGCYTLGYGPPLETADALLCMGAGFTLAAGVSRVTGKRTVGFVGDSTFFHSGMPALLNAVKEDVDMVAVILDNKVTAMTGHQESAGNVPRHEVSIEAVVRALGVERVETVDAYDLPRTVAAFRRAREGRGVSVVIVERACPVHEARQDGDRAEMRLYEVDPSRCRVCGREPAGLRCEQRTTQGFERQLARGRVMRTPACPPAEAPCTVRCPLALCIPGYVGHIAAGDYVGALEHVLNRTPLPETVCRVCHRPCERVCVRADTDAPVAINDLKRFVVAWAARQAGDSHRPELEPVHGKRVAVVGAGPSGLTAAHDLRLRGYAVTLFDAAERPGGLLAYGIPSHRLPREALERDVARILGLGIAFEGGTRLGRDIHLDGLLEDGYDAVYLAVGAGRAQGLELERTQAAEGPSVVEGLEYLRRVACDEPVESAGRVVVIGGGNAAVDASRTARRLGARRVALACLESRTEMPALVEEVAAAEREGVELHPGLRPHGLVAGGVVCIPAGEDGDKTVLEADQVIVAIGQEAELDFLDNDSPALAKTADGHLVVDPRTGRTTHPRIFAGGDVAGGERTVTGAMAAGQRAAWAIDRELRGAEAADRRPPPPIPGNGEPPEARAETRKAFRADRTRPPELPVDRRIPGFEEVVGPLEEDRARAEAARCLMCGLCGTCRACIELFACPALYESGGRVVIDPVLCTGCGVCAELCSNDAIREVPRG
jgi:indolepyruvate ferredoxin oxidoreductase alpha subunit